MILAPLEQLERYVGTHPRFAAAIAYIRRTDLATLAEGRHAIDGDDVYVSIDRRDGRGREGARLEAHREYIDLQITLAGSEEIGWTPLAACTRPGEPYSAERDIGFFDDAPRQWVGVPPGCFVVFFPEDAHAPLGGRGALHKAIVKIRA